MNLDLTPFQRESLWKQLQATVEAYYLSTDALPVNPELDPQKVIDYVEHPGIDLSVASVTEALDYVAQGMRQYAVHTPHPRYFGLFNPRAAFPAMVADTMTAAFNPQLAAWSHAPFAVEVENYLVREIGGKFGYTKDSVDGVFTTGGAEANLTAVLIALTHKFPHYAEDGLIGMRQRPMVYASAESHHSVVKAARAAGLGSESVKMIPVDDGFQMNALELTAQIAKDTAAGLVPFMVVVTGGTTAAGAIDPVPEIAAISQRYGLWLHLDAAYGGAVVVEESTRPLLAGSGQADSITFDAHKWLSMPMSTSVLLTRHRRVLSQTFGIATDYMPKEGQELLATDPFTHSVQWSRRFSGLKLYLSLLMVGWEGFAQLVRQQIHRGHTFRKLLNEYGWIIKNETELPIICFTDLALEADDTFAPFICDRVLASGQAWLSTYTLGTVCTLRVCITNYATQEADLHQLVSLLNHARTQYLSLNYKRES